MTKDEFLNMDRSADAAIKLFNDHYSGNEYCVDTIEQKMGIILGLSKHLLFKEDQLSLKYADKKFISDHDIQRAKSIKYTVTVKVDGLQMPKIISFESFMRSKTLPLSKSSTKRSYKTA